MLYYLVIVYKYNLGLLAAKKSDILHSSKYLEPFKDTEQCERQKFTIFVLISYWTSLDQGRHYNDPIIYNNVPFSPQQDWKIHCYLIFCAVLK